MEKSLSKSEISCLRAKGIEVTGFIGSGASGNVFAIAPYKGNDGLCIKYFYDYAKKTVEKEYERYRKLYYTEPGMFCRVFDLIWIEVPDDQFPGKPHHAAAMVMERLRPLDMLNQPLSTILKVLFDVLVCISFMHIIGIMHRDTKPENILYNDRTGTFTLIDFGIAYESKGTFTEPKCIGTFYYLSPESLKGCYSQRSELYSLGMVISEMLVGKEFDVPEEGELKEIAEKVYQIKKERNPLDETKFECPGLIRIVNKLTCFNREDRYQDYRAALKDVINLLKSCKGISISKEVRPAAKVMLFAVNELYRLGMSTSEVSEIVGQKRFNDTRVVVFSVSDRLYLKTNQDKTKELFAPDKPSGFLRELNAQIERVEALYKDCHFHPEIQLCIVGVSNKIKRHRNLFFRGKMPAICPVRQITVDDTVVDFESMGIDNTAIVNYPYALKQFLSENKFSDSLYKE